MINWLNSLTAIELLATYYAAAVLVTTASVVVVLGGCWFEDLYLKWRERRRVYRAAQEAITAWIVEDSASFGEDWR